MNTTTAITTEVIDQIAAPAKKATKKKVIAKVRTRKQPSSSPVKVSAAQKRAVGQVAAALAAGFLPIASYILAHFESKQNPMLWCLVAAALMFSAPTLVDWAKKWCGSKFKAVGFAVLLEGVMVFSHIQALSLCGLAILVLINSSNAWELYVQKKVD